LEFAKAALQGDEKRLNSISNRQRTAYKYIKEFYDTGETTIFNPPWPWYPNNPLNPKDGSITDINVFIKDSVDRYAKENGYDLVPLTK
jgi:hypothetical protein